MLDSFSIFLCFGPLDSSSASPGSFPIPMPVFSPPGAASIAVTFPAPSSAPSSSAPLSPAPLSVAFVAASAMSMFSSGPGLGSGTLASVAA